MSRRWRLAATASITRYPRRWLPIYGDDVIGRYHNAPYGSLPPHCFQEAEDAFSSLQKTRRNQAVVICGESGAGKTETTKDLSRGLGLPCYVFNCSDQMNYQTMADIFRGALSAFCRGAFTSMRLVSISRGRGWFIFRV